MMQLMQPKEAPTRESQDNPNLGGFLTCAQLCNANVNYDINGLLAFS